MDGMFGPWCCGIWNELFVEVGGGGKEKDDSVLIIGRWFSDILDIGFPIPAMEDTGVVDVDGHALFVAIDQFTELCVGGCICGWSGTLVL